MSVYVPPTNKYGNVVIGGTGSSGQVLSISNGTTAVSPTWTASNSASLTAKGKLKVEGEEADIYINGKSLSDWMSVVERRLAILQPKPELQEKYEALQHLYDQYKTLEALIYQTSEEK